MITLRGGPADGRTIMLRSAPDFLRITHVPGKNGGTWDGLDQPLDRPEPNEQIYVYRRTSTVATAHINAGRAFKGFVAIADYEFVEVDGETVRDPIAWSKFTRETPFEIPADRPRTREEWEERVRNTDRDMKR